MVSLSDFEYEKMKCDIQNLENENAILKTQLSTITERVKPLIVSFWEWFCSSTYVRDINRHDEGLKYAEDFLMDKIIEQNIALKKELNKANEWHYPSKGELPKCDDKTQLIFYVNCYYEIDGKTITRKRTVLGYYQNSFLNDDIKLFVEKSKGYEDEHLPKDVIAWKEIVLPMEIKEK